MENLSTKTAIITEIRNSKTTVTSPKSSPVLKINYEKQLNWKTMMKNIQHQKLPSKFIIKTDCSSLP